MHSLRELRSCFVLLIETNEVQSNIFSTPLLTCHALTSLDKGRRKIPMRIPNLNSHMATGLPATNGLGCMDDATASGEQTCMILCI